VRKLLLISTACILAGCETTLSELRDDPREKIAFHIAAPYAVVRPNIENTIRHCHKNSSTGPMNQFIVRAEEAPSGVATVTLWQEGYRTRPLYAVDLKESDAGTDVTFYHGPYDIFADYAPIVRGWVMGTGKCDGMFPEEPAVPPSVTPLPPETVITPL
jgi:hypothetical protein